MPHPFKAIIYIAILPLTLLLMGRAATQAASPAPPAATQRLIIQLRQPPLAETLAQPPQNWRTYAASRSAMAYQQALRDAQARVLPDVAARLPHGRIATYIDEHGREQPHQYTLLFNGFAIHTSASLENARQALATLPDVAAVYADRTYTPTLEYAIPHIHADELWQNPVINGRANAGAGQKFATIDAGLHPLAPMFDGTGYSYPAGYPLGDTSHTNGKIIVARAYFRADDPPIDTDNQTWPGASGNSHGLHTGSTAVGNPVTDAYSNTLMGVAPAAYAMSYKVFYVAESGQRGFNTAEGIAALEDIMQDGADVVNNSWGGLPDSAGGPHDPLDTALRNAWHAGIFVAMSAGNNGQPASINHPSDEYTVVGASLNKLGQLHLTTPATTTRPVIPFAIPLMKGKFELGEVMTASNIIASVHISPSNAGGCNPWPAGTFTDSIAVILISGSCKSANRIFYAQEAGAKGVIFYFGNFNLIYNYGCGVAASYPDHCQDLTIPSVQLSTAGGQTLLNWLETYTNTAALTLTFTLADSPNYVATFSARGPAPGQQLKPDLIAIGSAIYAQGYGQASGEAKHLGYNAAIGTSMASPQVAGAALLLQQIHPSWTQNQIKSALMGTAGFQNIRDFYTGLPAQPLDMGAGLLDLRRAADPGLLFFPPSLGYGHIPSGTTATRTLTLTSVATQTHTYTLAFLDTHQGFPGQAGLDGFAVQPNQLALGAGQSATVTLTFGADGLPAGDHQGYLIAHSAAYSSHVPLWARVVSPTFTADVLLIDHDRSSTSSATDYASIYTQTLENLGYSYTYLDADALLPATPLSILDAPLLHAHRAVLYFSGDNNASASFPAADRYLLNEYAHNGGTLIITSQNARRTLRGDPFRRGWGSYTSRYFYEVVLGAVFDSESVTGNATPLTLPVTSTAALPLAGFAFDVGSGGDGAGNQSSIDALEPITRTPYATVLMAGDAAVGMVHRQQPTLENPGVSFAGRIFYASFGLEGINDDVVGFNGRGDFLQRALAWGWDNPQGQILASVDGETRIFTAVLTSPHPFHAVRWDFGDGTPYTSFTSTAVISHSYAACAYPGYTPRAEVQDALGNHVILTLPRQFACQPALALTTTLSLDGSCGVTDVLTVTTGTAVTTCYTVKNTGQVTLTSHSLVDGSLPVPLPNGGELTLAPQASLSVTNTAVVTQSRVSTATWAAQTGLPETVQASDVTSITAVAPPAPRYGLFLPVVLRE